MVLTGTFSRTIDTKQRVNFFALNLPSGKRDVRRPGTDGSLALYTEEMFALLASRLTAASPVEEDVHLAASLHRPSAWNSTARPAQNPGGASRTGGSQKGIRFARRFDHLEVWDKRRWAVPCR